MTAVERMKQFLKDEYGIETAEELDAAVKQMKPINIGIFVTKPRKASESK